MARIALPAAVRNKAHAVGATAWLDALPSLVAALEAGWSLRVGHPFGDATEAFVAPAVLADGTQAVLKLLVPRSSDVARHEILCQAAERVWRPAPDCGLPTGATKGRWLIAFITRVWESLGRPCSERAVDVAIACAQRRIDAHDDERAVLVHGDVHEWNTLEAGDGFKLVDPDGLLAEAEYDMGILMREDPLELMTGDPSARARWLARRCGLDATAIWEWGMAERVSTGLLATQIGLQPIARHMLVAADHLSTL
jgi:streptomycin 6-kinase